MVSVPYQPALKFAYNLARSLHPLHQVEKWRTAKLRDRVFSDLNQISRTTDITCPIKNVLIDCTWYNPNYWARYGVLRKALNLSAAQETGILGAFSRRQTRQVLQSLAITTHTNFHAQTISPDHVKLANTLLENTQRPADILAYSLPHDFPGSALYDGILKRQRRASVSLKDPKISHYIAEFFTYLTNAEKIINSQNFDLLVVSHALDYSYLTLVWLALKRNIPVIVLYGDYGTQRFMRLNNIEEIYAYPNRPTPNEMSAMPPPAAARLASTGAAYLERRIRGHTTDVGAVYAYQKRQASINHDDVCRKFNWDPQKPIIGVYASNWFDYPHASGMANFADFLDWANVTLQVAATKTNVNWLFKSHPCDDWYASIQGSRLEDLVNELGQPHVRAAEKSWNGYDLICLLNGIVTCHGTIGLEATHFKTPVLTAHPGWYGAAGFTQTSQSREDFKSRLSQEWWRDVDTEDNAQKADLFTGWYFAVPEWNKDYIFHDDSNQDQILLTLRDTFIQNHDALNHEAHELWEWFKSGHPYYHIFKMSRSEAFALPAPPTSTR